MMGCGPRFDTVWLTASSLGKAALMVVLAATSPLLGCGAPSDAEADVLCSCDPGEACTAAAPHCPPVLTCEVDEDCQKDRPCRDGLCSGGVCRFTLTGEGDGCCTVDRDCEADHPCVHGTCDLRTGLCEFHVPDQNCCQVDSDCDDLVICTSDQCIDGRCVFHPMPEQVCCQTNADCNDRIPCTMDTCHTATGKCINSTDSSIPGCLCFDDSHCQDNNLCTAEACVDNECQFVQAINLHGEPHPGCCRHDADCQDDDLTTIDRCLHFQCVNQRMKKCYVDSQCEDGNPCTEDRCLDSYCQMEDRWKKGCNCTIDKDCNSGTPCVRGQCSDNECVFSFNSNHAGCCFSDDDCDDDIACTRDICSHRQCSWIPFGDRCCHDSSHCPKPDKPCREAVCDKGRCTTVPVLQCCKEDSECDDDHPCTTEKCEVGQCFYWYLEGCCVTNDDCDDGDPCTTDRCGVTGWCAIPQHKVGCCTHDGQCNDQNPCTTDKCVNNFCWHLDGPDCCIQDSDCTQQKEIDCQTPRCQNGNCLMVLGAGCCLADSDCTDAFPLCTIDRCVNNQCVNDLAPVEGCCLTDADCTAIDPCLSGTCKPTKQCLYNVIPDCCHNDAECSDGEDVCTVDQCVNHRCVHIYTGAPGCCEPFTWERNFDDGQVGGFVIANSFTMSDLLSDPMIGMLLQMMGITDISLGWQVTAACGSYSPTFSLYYGMAPLPMLGGNQCAYGLDALGGLMPGFPNMLPASAPPAASPIPGADSLTDMPSSGTATTPSFALPAGQGHHLQFWLKASINKTSDVDEFRVEVLEGETPTTVWKKTDLADADYDTWTQITIDLKGWEGKTIGIRFSFDTLEGTGDGGTGINIDDISITADCNPS